MRSAETKDELIELCRLWDNDVPQFTQLVADGLRLLDISEAEFAKELRTSSGVVRRWVNGFAHPTLFAQKNIITAIYKRALGHGVLGAVKKDAIREWLNDGLRRGATHMFIVYDADMEEVYHPYVEQGEKAEKRHAFYDSQRMHCVLAIYSLAKDIESQLSEKRPWHLSG